MSLAAIASVTLGFVAAMMLAGSTALYPPEQYIFHQQRIHPAQYIKPTARQRNGSLKTSIYMKPTAMQWDGSPLTHTTLDEVGDEPSFKFKTDHLSPAFLIQSSTVIARNF